MNIVKKLYSKFIVKLSITSNTGEGIILTLDNDQSIQLNQISNYISGLFKMVFYNNIKLK